jgi:hypothetical protein
LTMAGCCGGAFQSKRSWLQSSHAAPLSFASFV